MRVSHADWTSEAQRMMPLAHRGGGLDRIRLLCGKEGTLGNYDMSLAWAAESFTSPRHRHNFDQIRYNITGRMHYGPRKFVHAGEVCYFPEGTGYGPQVQADAGAPALTLVIQFGGASRSGFLSERQVRTGYEALCKLGSFEGGVFHQKDGVDILRKRKLDGYEAIWEYVNGRPLQYPPPRYDEPILMRPESFAWQPDQRHDRAARRQLGTFGELSLDVAQLHLARGELPVTAEGRPHLQFVLDGEVEIDGSPLYKHSAAEISAGETAVLRASQSATLLSIGMPRFDDAVAAAA